MRWRSPWRAYHKLKTEYCDRVEQEHDWYAWHPVKIHDQWVWLEVVLRRGNIARYRYIDWSPHVSSWNYRFKE